MDNRIRDPYLDWHKLDWHFMQFKIAPEHLYELKPVELAHLLLYVADGRSKWARELNDWLITGDGRKVEGFPPIDPNLEALEEAVKAEQQRRKGEAPEPKYAQKREKKESVYKIKEEKILPGRLADMVINPEILPRLFNHIKHKEDMDRSRKSEAKPNFGRDGYTGGEKYNAGPLMGLMDCLMDRGQIKAGKPRLTAIDAYLVYCAELGMRPNLRPNEARVEGGIYGRIYRYADDFFRIQEGEKS